MKHDAGLHVAVGCSSVYKWWQASLWLSPEHVVLEGGEERVRLRQRRPLQCPQSSHHRYLRSELACKRQQHGIPQPGPRCEIAGCPRAPTARYSLAQPNGLGCCKGGIMARINPKHIVRHTSPDTVRGMCGIRLETTTAGDVPPGCRYSESPHLHQIG
jgi:hypothetical protein